MDSPSLSPHYDEMLQELKARELKVPHHDPEGMDDATFNSLFNSESDENKGLSSFW